MNFDNISFMAKKLESFITINYGAYASPAAFDRKSKRITEPKMTDALLNKGLEIFLHPFISKRNEKTEGGLHLPFIFI